MSWQEYFFHEKMKEKSEEITQRKTLQSTKKTGMTEAKVKLGLKFAAELMGKQMPSLEARLFKKGQVFLSNAGSLSAIVQRKGELIWIDISETGEPIAKVSGAEAITEAIDTSGEWMQVAGSTKEMLDLMKQGVLGCPDEMRKQWGQTV